MSYCVYIIFSEKLNKFYVGTSDNFLVRLDQHNNLFYDNSFTKKGIPWVEFLVINSLNCKQAYLIEKHIKNMKSKNYILNLKKYPNLVVNLCNKFA